MSRNDDPALAATTSRDPALAATASSDHGPSSDAHDDVVPVRGATLGRYTVLEPIGAGGMGVVIAAYDPRLDRRVAVKLLRPGSGGPAAHARLLREAQAMARLSDPNVLTVFDVGEADGRIFVAMEYAEGGTLARWLAQEPRTWREIVRAFCAAGRGLAAAHAAKLVHRDFKPDNVLVGADGRFRVTDFGLVISTDDDPGGTVMGTPLYMAPEQHRGEPTGPATDQFSFCVALYLALWKQRPFDGETPIELLERVREGPPRPPPASEVPARIRQAILRGLSADPAARHPSMLALLAALEPPRSRYRGVALAVALVTASAGVTIALVRGGDSAPPACAADAQRAHLDRVWSPGPRRDSVHAAFTSTNRTYAEDTFGRVADRLDAYTEGWVAARVEVCAATRIRGEQSEALLDLRMACLDRRRTELDALIDVLADTASSGVLDKTVDAAGKLTPLTSCDDVAALQAVTPVPSDAETRARIEAARADLARVRALEQTGQYDDALTIARATAETATTLVHAPLVAEALVMRAQLEDRTGDSAAAEATLHLALLAAASAHDDRLAVEAWGRLLHVVGFQLGRPDDALALRTAAEAALRRAGEVPDEESRLWSTLGVVYLAAGKPDEARPLLERALVLIEGLLGPDHPRVGNVLAPLSSVLMTDGDYAGALVLHQRMLAVYEAAYGPDHPLLSIALNNLAEGLRQLGRFEESHAAFRRALTIRENALGEDHPQVATSLHNLALSEMDLHDDATARAHLERALAIRVAKVGPDHIDVADTLRVIARIDERAGALAQAQRAYERALEIQTKALGADHPSLAYTLSALANLALDAGRNADARLGFARALELAEPARGADHPELAEYLTGLAAALLELGRDAEARPYAERAVKIGALAPGRDVLLAQSRFVLARALGSVPRERERARALAEQARVDFVAADRVDQTAAVDAWLRSR